MSDAKIPLNASASTVTHHISSAIPSPIPGIGQVFLAISLAFRFWTLVRLSTNSPVSMKLTIYFLSHIPPAYHGQSGESYVAESTGTVQAVSARCWLMSLARLPIQAGHGME